MPTPLTPAPSIPPASPPELRGQPLVSLADRVLGHLTGHGGPKLQPKAKPKQKLDEDVHAAVSGYPVPALRTSPFDSIALTASGETAAESGDASRIAAWTAIDSSPVSMPAVPASAEAESVAIGRDRLAWSSEGEVADPESTSPNRLDGELSKLGSLVGDGVVEKFMSMTRTPGGAGQAPAPAESSDDDGSLEAASARAESLPIEAIDVSRVHERRARGESHSESPATVVPDASKAVASSLASLSAPLRLELPALGSMDAVAHRRDIDRLVTAMASPQAGADRPVASQLHYAFRSWGAGHAVTAQMVLGSLVFQASSPRVGSALAAAMPDGVSNAPWRIEATDATSDEDTARKRRG